MVVPFKRCRPGHRLLKTLLIFQSFSLLRWLCRRIFFIFYFLHNSGSLWMPGLNSYSRAMFSGLLCFHSFAGHFLQATYWFFRVPPYNNQFISSVRYMNFTCPSISSHIPEKLRYFFDASIVARSRTAKSSRLPFTRSMIF